MTICSISPPPRYNPHCKIGRVKFSGNLLEGMRVGKFQLIEHEVRTNWRGHTDWFPVTP